ncbi:hypothetical protein JNUCC0626_46850 [Lentzea sp. JNUCC 0626]|uniref:hypothetical protein n=1 Tax=Lentzea sp. JNUCC 0626 TaxID=3367513 RepID=UPI003747D124
MRRAKTAPWALSVLLQWAILEIRTTASTRRVPAGVECDDYVDRIRMLAEITHQLSPALGLPTDRLRRRTAVRALEWQWTVAPPEARAWIAATLAAEGASITDFIDVEAAEARARAV